MKKSCFILLLLVGIVHTWASAGVERREPETSVLIDRPNPMLAGIEKLCVSLEPPDIALDKAGFVWGKLNEKIESRLETAGIHGLPSAQGAAQAAGPAEIRIDVDMVELAELNLFVFHIQTLLTRQLLLDKSASRSVKADIWKTEAVMKPVKVEDMPSAVTETILEQVDAFVGCHKIANPNGVSTADANAAVVVEPLKPAFRNPAAGHKYVASKNSKVFHRPDCPWAERIKPQNLVVYNSRQAALHSGKRPCKRCKP